MAAMETVQMFQLSSVHPDFCLLETLTTDKQEEETWSRTRLRGEERGGGQGRGGDLSFV